MATTARNWLLVILATLIASAALPVQAAAPNEPKTEGAAAAADKPIRALLVIGGCCHDYAKQKDILTKGISGRANVEWSIAYDPDKGTKHLNPVYEKEDWYKGFDVIVHDECSADVKDLAIINDRILKPHKDGLPGVVLHCGMHCYRSEGYPKAVTPWFEFTGLQTTGHGPQLPIDITYVDKEHPITKPLENWTTMKEELYNNITGKVLDTAKPLARGKQGKDETVVTWVNTYKGKARVFASTLGHNNETVADPRYLDMVTRGLLWSVDKLDEKHLKPAKKVLIDGAAGAAPAGADAPKAGAAAGAKGVPTPENVAHGKTATSSTYQGDDLAAKAAVDGDPGTRWCAENGKVPQWLAVDLGKPQDLTGCRIFWEKDDTFYSYTIEGSADGKTWAVLADQTKAPAKKQDEVVKFDAKGIRHLRLNVLGTGPGAWASLFEFEALGTKMVAAGDRPKPVAQPVDPQKILAGVKAPAGFLVTLFAAPPDVSYPTCVAASPTGELYVGVDEQGSLGKTPGGGRVVRCIDTDNDGKADKFNVFAKMEHPRGLFWDGATNILYVQHPPFLTAYHDDNGDGVADRETLLVKGIANEKIQAERGADHTTNGIRLGIDGWIYVAMGDFGVLKATGKDGTELVMHGGGVVRVRTDGSGLEEYSFGQRNIYDVAVDPYLNCFTRDNTNDGDGWDVRLSHVIPTGNYGYPRLFRNSPDEIVKPLADYGAGSPCGSLFVDEPGLPPEIGHALYTVEWGRNVYRHPLTADGAGFKAGQVEFLKFEKGTDIDIDGQGRFYVSSWVNGGFAYSGPNVGYVVRVAPSGGATPAAFPDLRKATVAQLVKHVGSPSGVLRLAAQRELLARADARDKSVLTGASGLAKLAESDGPLAGRVAALFTLRQLLGSLTNETLADMAAKKADLREFILRALADQRNSTKSPAGPFLAGLTDANPRVRLQAAWGLARLGKADAAPAIVPLVADADPLVSHVAINSLVSLKASDACLKAVDPANPTLVPGALRVLKGIHDVKVVDGLVERLNKTQDPAFRSQLYKALCRLYVREADYDGSWWGTRPDTSGPYYKTAEWDGTPKVREVIKTALTKEKPEFVRELLAECQRNKVNFPEIGEYIAKASATDPAFKALAFQAIVGKANLTDADVALAKSVAAAASEAPAVRVKAVRLLNKSGSPAALDAVIEALAAVAADEKAPKELTGVLEEFVRDSKHVKDLGYFAKLAAGTDSPAKREVAYAVLVSVADSKLAKPDAKAAAAKAIDAGWQKPDAAAPLLRAIGLTKVDDYNDRVKGLLADKNAEIAAAAGYAAGRLRISDKPPAAGGTTPVALIESLPYEKVLEAVKTGTGDVALGKDLYTRQGCIACHTTTADEPPKGPFLGGIGTRYNRVELLESILKPSAKISQGFETQWFRTTDGDEVDGFVTREAGDEIEYRNVAGVVAVLKKKEIKSRGKRETSIMPDGLVAKLSPQDLANIVAYLESLKAK